MLKLNLKDLASAVISAIIVAIVSYLGTVTSITNIDPQQILNIAFLTGIASLLKALGTTDEGKFLGGVAIK